MSAETSTATWGETVDVLVVGSGAGGLWIPNNHLMAGVGIHDTPEDAWKYLKGGVGDAGGAKWP
jgi:hypothetical protein